MKEIENLTTDVWLRAIFNFYLYMYVYGYINMYIFYYCNALYSRAIRQCSLSQMPVPVRISVVRTSHFTICCSNFIFFFFAVSLFAFRCSCPQNVFYVFRARVHQSRIQDKWKTTKMNVNENRIDDCKCWCAYPESTQKPNVNPPKPKYW